MTARVRTVHVCFSVQVLAHTAAIVMFTLLVNATTMKKLLDKLGMSDISDSKKIAMANAVRQVKESNQRTLTMLKADRFLADADWDIAERDCEMYNPYMEIDDGEVIRHFRLTGQVARKSSRLKPGSFRPEF